MMADDVLRIETTVALDAAAAFDTIVDELTLALSAAGIAFEPGLQGRVTEGDVAVGRVVDWVPGSRVCLEWRPATWEPEQVTELELRFEAGARGTRVVLEHRGFGALLGDAGESAGWFARAVVAPLVRAIAPAGFGDWYTDRHARRPSGALARATYRNPLYHRPNFLAILERLALTRDDSLVEVGCGGGAFLFDALASGCRAAAVDHSREMVRLARGRARADGLEAEVPRRSRGRGAREAVVHIEGACVLGPIPHVVALRQAASHFVLRVLQPREARADEPGTLLRIGSFLCEAVSRICQALERRRGGQRQAHVRRPLRRA